MLFKINPSVPTVWPRGNTDKLPMELDISTSRESAVKKILAGTLFAIIGGIAFNSFTVSAQIGSNIGLLYQVLTLFIVALGVVTFALGVIGYSDRRIARFENGHSLRPIKPEFQPLCLRISMSFREASVSAVS